MANEESPEEIITITSDFSDDFSTLYLKRTLSDITLILGRQKLYAHKVILAIRCKYFESFLTNPNQSEMVIDDVSAEVFQKVLKYIYTGSISLQTSNTDLVFNVMKLAIRYLLTDLEKKISGALTAAINVENVFDFLNKANLYNMEGLRSICHDFIEKQPELLQDYNITQLTQKSMVKLLERHALRVREIEIFNTVAWWCEVNKDKNESIIQCVRLNLLTDEEILSIVFPSKLVESEKLLMILARGVKSKLPDSRIKNENLVTVEHGTQFLYGYNTAFLLSKKCDSSSPTYHPIDDKMGVTLKFKCPFYVNHIRMRLWDEDNRCYSYYIEVSLDQKNWKKIVDYSKYRCRSYQDVYFEEISVLYIRIVGTFSSIGERFMLTTLAVFSKSDIPRIKNGVVCPKDNIADPKNGTMVIEGMNTEWLLTNHKNFNFCYHKIDSRGCIIIHLGQPYIISTMKFLLRKDDSRKYSYFVETSVNSSDWEMAVDFRKHLRFSWQKLYFPERPVVYVKIVGTYCSKGYKDGESSSYTSYYFECACLEIPAKNYCS